MQVRIASWIIAAIFLSAFCWLGMAADKFAPIFYSLGVPLPTTTRLVLAYGLVTCPMLGLFAAISLILTDKLRSGFGRLAQPALIIIYALFAVNIFMSLMPPFGTVSSIALK
ncbi:MAG: hypothetical protein ACO1QS_09265 [Verrucomicrobiota bacterium]